MRITGGVVLGVGLGGFADGIALHQIAQWHNMGSAVLPPDTMDAMRQNMVWDGSFHAATWIITLTGVDMLWNAARAGMVVESAGEFTGQMLFGWGISSHQLHGMLGITYKTRGSLRIICATPWRQDRSPRV